MSDFRLGTIPSSSILHLYSLRESIWFNPPYQRLGDVWNLEKRQLLIDSIINGYDIPKLYFHEFFPAKPIDGKKYKYAIIDGKQRLETIFSYIKGEFALDKGIELVSDPSVKPGEQTYMDLARNFPDIKTRFDGFVLPIVTILTDDTELIEDMFSRLNEAVPLNAAEKRNALGGPLPNIIRTMTSHDFFCKKLPFDNKRYRHYDLASKFLYIAQRDNLPDTKKVHLDEFVKNYRDNNIENKIDHISKISQDVLDKMAGIFVNEDTLLRSAGTVVLYYYLFLQAHLCKWTSSLSRSQFENFEHIRIKNRADAEIDVSKADFSLLEYDRFTQSPNDGVALRYRYDVLRRYIGPKEGTAALPLE